jgi:CheY-like chemotaxis protein
MEDVVDILILEDEDEILKIFSKALKSKKISFVRVKNGDEALELLNEIKYKLIILDIFVPGIKGNMVFEKIRESIHHINFNTDVILIPGVIDRAVKDCASFDNPPMVLSKPFKVKKFLDVICEKLK